MTISSGHPAPGAVLRPSGSGAVDEAVALWGALTALGVRDVVLAPGSRSAPLVYALQDPSVRDRLRAHVRIDERAAAFTALGISRADPAHPGVVVTTSGTAAAHLHAAVLEAHHAGVPLVVITADRPAELRDTGANQTTHQAGLYGDAVRFAADLPAPGSRAATPAELRTAVSTVARAVAAATGERPGPVHLNVGFRDPLTPSVEPLTPSADGADTLTGATPDDVPLPAPTLRIAPSDPAPVTVALDPRTVVVAGDGAGPAASDFAARHALPLFAEPSSGARRGPTRIAGYPALLREVMAEPGHPLRPAAAVVFGRPTLSRPVVSALLGAEDVDVVVVDRTGTWPDAARNARLVVPAIVGDEGALRDGHQHDGDTPDAPFLAAWLTAARSRPAVAASWQARAAQDVWDATGEDDVFVLGSSSLVRDLEASAGEARGTVVANRGLAGIDGMISTATGYALAAGRRTRPEDARPAARVRLLLGDLTAVHDLTGLVLGPGEPSPELDVVVVDDGGGRIFSGLEHAAADPDVLRRFFTTPHGIDLVAVARGLGVDAMAVRPEELAPRLAERPGGRRVLVVRA